MNSFRELVTCKLKALWRPGTGRGAAVLACALVTFEAWAQAPKSPPEPIAAGGQHFDADTDGLRTYLESIRSQDPHLYGVLDPKLSSLETKSGVATGWLIGGLVVGSVVAVVGGAMAMQRTSCDLGQAPGDERSEECEDERAQREFAGFTLVAVGAGIAVGGVITWFVVKPSRSDLMDLVNEHNRLSPSRPLRLQLGYDPHPRVARANIVWSF